MGKLVLKSLVFVVLMAALLNIGGEAMAQESVPRMIRFQGRLKDVNQADVEDTVEATFNIYNVETGGIALWSETQTGVLVENGVLDVVLGSVTALTLPFNEQYYLGVEVAQDGEMTPRFTLTSVPYAIISEN